MGFSIMIMKDIIRRNVLRCDYIYIKPVVGMGRGHNPHLNWVGKGNLSLGK